MEIFKDLFHCQKLCRTIALIPKIKLKTKDIFQSKYMKALFWDKTERGYPSQLYVKNEEILLQMYY